MKTALKKLSMIVMSALFVFFTACNTAKPNDHSEPVGNVTSGIESNSIQAGIPPFDISMEELSESDFSEGFNMSNPYPPISPEDIKIPSELTTFYFGTIQPEIPSSLQSVQKDYPNERIVPSGPFKGEKVYWSKSIKPSEFSATRFYYIDEYRSLENGYIHQFRNDTGEYMGYHNFAETVEFKGYTLTKESEFIEAADEAVSNFINISEFTFYPDDNPMTWGGEQEAYQYCFRYIKKINGINSAEKVTCQVRADGYITSCHAENIGMFDNVIVPEIDEEYLLQCANVKAAPFFEKYPEERWEITDKQLKDIVFRICDNRLQLYFSYNFYLHNLVDEKLSEMYFYDGFRMLIDFGPVHYYS